MIAFIGNWPAAGSASRAITLFLAAVWLLLIAGMDSAWAQQVTDCSVKPVAGQTIDFGTIDVGRPVGTVFGHQQFTVQIDCGANAVYYALRYTPGVPPVNGTGTWATNMPGVVVQLSYANQVFVNGIMPEQLATIATITHSDSITMEAQLVRVNGAVSSGTVTGNHLWGFMVGLGPYENNSNQSWVNVTANVYQNTCDIEPVLPVKLDPVSMSALKQPGSSAGDKPFQIKLACWGRFPLGMVMTDLQSTTNTSDQLNIVSSVDGQPAARNVKLRILNGSTPIAFGAKWLVEPVDALEQDGPKQNITAAFVAQYYSDGGNASAGPVSALAEFTLTYD
jgi:type 1 fimbria pilin